MEMLVYVFLLFVCGFLFLISKSLRVPKLEMPGPKGIPIFGNSFELIKNKENIVQWFAQQLEEHNDTIVVRDFSRNLVLTSNPDVAKFFLLDKFSEFRRGQMPHFLQLFGNGIFTSNGDNWKAQRSIARPMFKINSLVSMVPTFVKNSQTLEKIIGGLKPNEDIDVQDLFMRYTLDSIAEIGFGFSINSLEKGKSDFANNFDEAQRRSETMTRNFIKRSLGDSVFDATVKYLDDFVYTIIKERHQKNDYHDAKDLLSLFMQLSDEEGNPFPDSYLRDVILNFFIAGRDTTALLLTWTTYLLCQNPRVVQKIREEIKQVVGDQQITYENMNKLKYTKNVLKESLRLYPPVPIAVRKPVVDVTLPTGHVVPKNTPFVYNAYALHRNKKYWGEDAELFKPERWEDPLKHPFQFVGFHQGPQACLGQNMALLEASIVVAQLVPKFDFTLNPNHKVVATKNIVFKAKDGVRCYCQRVA